MATPEWATRPSASRFGKFKRVFNVSTTKGKLAVFLLSFALIGGGYMVYQSFAATLTGADGEFTSLTPARILDTRNGTGGITSAIGAGRTIQVQITGKGRVPAKNVKAVTLNLTAVSPSTSGFMVVWPSQSDKPNTSSINFAAGQTVAKAVTVPVGPDGKVQIYNESGMVHAIFDVSGYYTTSGGQRGTRFQSLSPGRILDTRTGLGAPKAPVGAGRNISVQVAGLAGVPSSGARAVVLNLTATEPTIGGYLTVWPSGTTMPLTSNINFAAGQTIANQVTVPVGSDGKVQIYNASGTTHVIMDVAGYFQDVLSGQRGKFVSLTPSRILDTRTSGGAVGAGRTVSKVVINKGGLPPSSAEIRAVVMNVTVVGPTRPGFLTVWPSGSTRPATSNINFAAGQTIANQVTVPVGANGQLSIFNNATQSVHVIFDVAGYYLNQPPLSSKVVPCIGNGTEGARVQMVYARTAAQPDMSAIYEEDFQQRAAEMNAVVEASASKTGGVRKIRFVHNANCVPVINNVVITTEPTGSANELINELVGRGMRDDNRKYVVFVDSSSETQSWCGYGGSINIDPTIYTEWSIDPATNNTERFFGYVFLSKKCWGMGKAPGDLYFGDVAVHELFHTFGAVSDTAPNSTGEQHCTDDQDVMCYIDAANKPLNTNACQDPASNNLLDCNNDDYFHTNPPTGNYLSNNWNSADSRWLSRE